MRTSTYRAWLFSLALIAVTALAYQPAWNGKPIWDDDLHLTAPQFRSLDGLARIWIQPKTTQQYHPLVDTAFWLEEKLWGNSTLGYHLINILLHAAAALLLVNILRRLEVPGAWLAGAIFALHPVQVESVAWMVELKNTLSGVFFFAALLSYLGFDQSRSARSYSIVFTLFILGLLAKSIVAMLPVAILIVLWWKRGNLGWKRDVRPLIPLFVVGIAAGCLTAWMERKFSGAEGKEFASPLVERFLIAGRAFWFYLGKLFWPADLVLIYPRWNVSATVAWQYIFPIAALLLFVLLWSLRRRWRAPLAGFLFFVALLLPMLGFFNVYYFTFSFVADHFQYLPCVGIIALVSAGAVIVGNRLRVAYRPLGYGLCTALLAILAVLTWQHSQTFRDSETCFRVVLSRNPNSPTAHNNLGVALVEKGRVDEAIVHYEKALDIESDYQFACYNLAAAFLEQGRTDEAIPRLQKVLEVNPNHAKAYYSLANALAQKGQTDRAFAYYERALKLDPDFADAHGSFGNMLLEKGQIDSAMAHYRKAIEVDPGNATAHYNLAVALLRQGRPDEAVLELQKVLRIDPGYPEAKYFLDRTLSERIKKE